MSRAEDQGPQDGERGQLSRVLCLKAFCFFDASIRAGLHQLAQARVFVREWEEILTAKAGAPVAINEFEALIEVQKHRIAKLLAGGAAERVVDPASVRRLRRIDGRRKIVAMVGEHRQ